MKDIPFTIHETPNGEVWVFNSDECNVHPNAQRALEDIALRLDVELHAPPRLTATEIKLRDEVDRLETGLKKRISEIVDLEAKIKTLQVGGFTATQVNAQQEEIRDLRERAEFHEANARRLFKERDMLKLELTRFNNVAGELEAAHSRINKQESTIASLEHDLLNLDSFAQDRKNESCQLKTQVANLLRIRDLDTADTAKRVEKIYALQAEVEMHKAGNDKLVAECDTKSRCIQDLQEKLNSANLNIISSNLAVNQLRTDVRDLTAKFESGDIKVLRAELRAANERADEAEKSSGVNYRMRSNASAELTIKTQELKTVRAQLEAAWKYSNDMKCKLDAIDAALKIMKHNTTL